MSQNQFSVGEKATHFIIDEVAKANTNFRSEVLWTGKHSQLVAMTIPVGGEIGDEVHDTTDQLLSFVSGSGEADLDGETHTVDAGDLCAVPAGTPATTSATLAMSLWCSTPSIHLREHAIDAEYATKEVADAAEASGEDAPPQATT